jgi:dipeptidyl aminopeptidase/acylaminoacyl peptidase
MIHPAERPNAMGKGAMLKSKNVRLALTALLLLSACGKKTQDSGQGTQGQPSAEAPGPGQGGSGGRTPDASASLPDFDPAQVDATRLTIARVSTAPDLDRDAFPLVTEFQDPRIVVKVLSPDKRRLVWRGQDSQGYWLFMSDADGRHTRRLDHCRNGYQPVWSPDSRRILYSAMDWRHFERNLSIYSIHTGGNVVRAFNSKERLGALAAWSPDGGKIVFNYYGNLWIMNSDGIGCVLLDLSRRIGQAVREAGRIAWSRDGRLLAYQMRGDRTVYILTLAPRSPGKGVF